MNAPTAPPTKVRLDVEGRDVEGCVGETLAAALVRAGERVFRIAESGAERGLFCGMGVCQECVVEVDGIPNRRACMTKVTAPHTVRRQRVVDAAALSAVPGEPSPAPGAGEVLTPQLLVLGGGAAGLSAAAVAAEAGIEVMLVDERPQPGGQYFKQRAEPAVAAGSVADDPQFAGGRRLIDRARAAGVVVLAGAEVWGAFQPLEIGILAAGANCTVRPERLIVATGAYERAVPFSGWTLPGVMMTGAAQTLWRSYGVLAGRRILVAGNGPLNLQVAAELARGGADVVAVAEASRALGRSGSLAGPALAMLRASPGLALQGFGYLRALRRNGVPLLTGRVIGRVEARREGLAATLRRLDDAGAVGEDAETFEVDTVCLGYGFQPQNDVLRALGARHDFDPKRGHLVTRLGRDGATTVANVWAAGDCTGLGGAPAAADGGIVAGVAAARSLGVTVPEPLAGEAAAARRRLPRHRAFQSALWQAFAAPWLTDELTTPDTHICRCESVSAAAVEAAFGDGAQSIGEVKRATRLGMGRCQGRYCAPILAAIIARRGGALAPDELSLFAPRAPIKPVTIADLLATGRP